MSTPYSSPEWQPPPEQPGPPPYSGQPPYGWGYGYQPPPRRTNGMAVASMIVGILWLYWIGSILALIFGYVARGQIRRTGEGGGGMAVAGIVLGWIGIGLLVIFIIAVAAGTVPSID